MIDREDDVASRACILIIDDEPANVRLLERLLLSGGYSEVHGTTDPRDALARFDELRPDLVMLDLHMPHVDGFEMLAALRDRAVAGDIFRCWCSPRTRRARRAIVRCRAARRTF